MTNTPRRANGPGDDARASEANGSKSTTVHGREATLRTGSDTHAGTGRSLAPRRHSTSAASAALGTATMRGTVEEALRRVVAAAPDLERERRAAQMALLSRLGDYVDLDVLASDEMWR